MPLTIRARNWSAWIADLEKNTPAPVDNATMRLLEHIRWQREALIDMKAPEYNVHEKRVERVREVV